MFEYNTMQGEEKKEGCKHVNPRSTTLEKEGRGVGANQGPVSFVEEMIDLA
jgi:hypothetical protein